MEIFPHLTVQAFLHVVKAEWRLCWQGIGHISIPSLGKSQIPTREKSQIPPEGPRRSALKVSHKYIPPPPGCSKSSYTLWNFRESWHQRCACDLRPQLTEAQETHMLPWMSDPRLRFTHWHRHASTSRPNTNPDCSLSCCHGLWPTAIEVVLRDCARPCDSYNSASGCGENPDDLTKVCSCRCARYNLRLPKPLRCFVMALLHWVSEHIKGLRRTHCCMQLEVYRHLAKLNLWCCRLSRLSTWKPQRDYPEPRNPEKGHLGLSNSMIWLQRLVGPRSWPKGSWGEGHLWLINWGVKKLGVVGSHQTSPRYWNSI